MKNFYIFFARALRLFGVKTCAIHVRTQKPLNNEFCFVAYRLVDFKRHLKTFCKGGKVFAYPITKRYARKLRKNENCFD